MYEITPHPDFDHKTHSQCRNIQATLRVPTGGASATCESLSRMRSKTIYQPKDRRNKQETAWKYQVNDQFGATDVTITTQIFLKWITAIASNIWVINMNTNHMGNESNRCIYIYIQSHTLRFELCWVLQTTNTSVRTLRHLELKITAKCFILTMPLMTWLQTPFKNRITLSKHTTSFKSATRHQQKHSNKKQQIFFSPSHPPLAQVQDTNNSTWLGPDVGSLGSVWAWTCKGLGGHGITSNAQKWKL